MATIKHLSVNLMVTVASFFLGACGPSEEEAQPTPEAPKQWQWQQCVDENGNIVPDENCDNAQQSTSSTGGYAPYHWWFFYGGRPLFVGQNLNQLTPGSYRDTPFPGAQTNRMAGFTASHPAHPRYQTTTRGVLGNSANTRSAIG